MYNYYKIDGDKLTDTNTKIHTFYRSYDSIKKMILILKILYWMKNLIKTVFFIIFDVKATRSFCTILHKMNEYIKNHNGFEHLT